MNNDWRFLVGTETKNGRVMPIGWSKDWEYALEIARLHKAKIYELKEIKG